MLDTTRHAFPAGDLDASDYYADPFLQLLRLGRFSSAGRHAWFGVSLATPFAPGAEVSGQINIRGYEHVTMTIWIETMEPERFFSFRWHPYAIEPGVDYSAEPRAAEIRNARL